MMMTTIIIPTDTSSRNNGHVFRAISRGLKNILLSMNFIQMSFCLYFNKPIRRQDCELSLKGRFGQIHSISVHTRSRKNGPIVDGWQSYFYSAEEGTKFEVMEELTPFQKVN